MAEYSRIYKGNGTTDASSGILFPINLPFQPNVLQWWNYTSMTTPASGGLISGYWDSSMGQGYALTNIFNATPVATTALVSSGGVSTFSAGQMLQMGPLILLGTTAGDGIAKTSGTVLTVTAQTPNAIFPGQWIVFQNLFETATTGMQQIAGIPFQVQSTNWSTSSTQTIFQVAWLGNASNLTAIDSAATASVAGTLGFRQILYPTLYEPGVAYPYTITVTAGVGTVTTTAPHNFKVGQEIAFRIPTVPSSPTIYGAQNLNALPDILIPGSPQYFYVSSVVNATQFTFANAPVLSSAFTVNAPFAAFPGLEFPQVVAVGDINTGGELYNGGNLYPSPRIYTGLTQSNTINGPAILGSFVNNTSQGFSIGKAGAIGTIASAAQQIYFIAMLTDGQVN